MTSKELRAYNKKDGKFLGGQVKWWSDDMRTRQFSPTGGWLATEKKNEVELGKAKMDVVRLGPGLTSQVQSLAFSHDGKRLAACDNSAIRIWETSTKKPVRTLDAPGGKETRHRMALSADGKLLAFARGPQITLWSVQSGEKLATLEGHRSEVRALAFRADGAMLASGDMGGEMRLWDPANGKPAETILYPALTGIRHMSFSPDAKVLLVTSEGDLYAPNGSVVQMDDTPAFLRLINVASGREYARYRLQNPNVPPIFDGNTLILVGPDPAKLKAGEVSQWSLP
jgi:WD40 repeat protein